jgi:hypothetical protein
MIINQKTNIMQTNVGTTDKVIRIIIAAAAAALIVTNTLTGTWAIVVGIVGAIMLITGLTGFCGLYKVFGMSTCPIEKK